MNNDNKVETAMAELNCWASYATEGYIIVSHLIKMFKKQNFVQYLTDCLAKFM